MRMDYSSPSARKNKRRGRGFLRGLLNPARSCSGRSPSPATSEERTTAPPPPAMKADTRKGNNALAAVKKEQQVAHGDYDAAATLRGRAVHDDHDEDVDRRAEKLIASLREKIRAQSSSG